MAQTTDISLELKREVAKGNFIRQTQSICPDCNRILPAIVFEREGKVFMTKTCPVHGETEELYFGSYDMYAKFSRFWKDGKGTHAPNVPMDACSCPANCGLCSNHLSHTGLSNIIVTNRCDLTCWYCFFYVKKGLEGPYVYEPTLDCVGAERMRQAFPVRSMLATGMPITQGSDGPAYWPIDPLRDAQTVVTRTTHAGSVVEPDEAISVDAALRMITRNAAHSGFEERDKGSIEPGKLADFALLARNPYEVAPHEIASIPVDATIIGGRTVFQRRGVEVTA